MSSRRLVDLDDHWSPEHVTLHPQFRDNLAQTGSSACWSAPSPPSRGTQLPNMPPVTPRPRATGWPAFRRIRTAPSRNTKLNILRGLDIASPDGACLHEGGASASLSCLKWDRDTRRKWLAAANWAVKSEWVGHEIGEEAGKVWISGVDDDKDLIATAKVCNSTNPATGSTIYTATSTACWGPTSSTKSSNRAGKHSLPRRTEPVGHRTGIAGLPFGYPRYAGSGRDYSSACKGSWPNNVTACSRPSQSRARSSTLSKTDGNSHRRGSSRGS